MKKILSRAWMLAGLLLLAPITLAGDDNPITITLRESVEVVGGEVFLADVAVITGAGDNVSRHISGIKVCLAPSTGATSKLTRTDIEQQLRKNYIDTAQVIFNGVSQVTITRTSRTMSSAEIRELIRGHVIKEIALENADFTVEFTRPVQDLILPEGDVEFKIERQSGYGPVGQNQLLLTVTADGQTIHRLLVPVTLRAYQNVIISRRQLSRGTILTSGDVELKRIEIKELTRRPVTEIENITGRRLIITIPANRIIYESNIEEAPAVIRNQYVTILGRTRSVSVTARGQALDEGRTGDFIKVMNLASNKIIVARVVNPEVVEIVSATSERGNIR